MFGKISQMCNNQFQTCTVISETNQFPIITHRLFPQKYDTDKPIKKQWKMYFSYNSIEQKPTFVDIKLYAYVKRRYSGDLKII